MASSYKQSFLKLSKFIGTDKPKMDDYNNDNRLIDENAALTDQRLKKAETHEASKTVHISDAERAKWNKFQWVTGTYVGDNKGEREINIGFKPRLGFVFQEDEFTATAYDTDCILQSEQRLAIITDVGCTKYTAATQNGFIICSTNNVRSDQRMPRLNIGGCKYVYVMFR